MFAHGSHLRRLPATFDINWTCYAENWIHWLRPFVSKHDFVNERTWLHSQIVILLGLSPRLYLQKFLDRFKKKSRKFFREIKILNHVWPFNTNIAGYSVFFIQFNYSHVIKILPDSLINKICEGRYCVRRT